MSRLDMLNKAIADLHVMLCEASETDLLAQTDMETVFDGLQSTTVLCHGLAAKSGWWSDKATGLRLGIDQINVPEKLCLIHSEVSEAMEGYRCDLMDDKLPHRKMIEVELADALIRIHDLAGFMGLDLAGATIEKLAFNQQRADHKMENRIKEDGKKF